MLTFRAHSKLFSQYKQPVSIYPGTAFHAPAGSWWCELTTQSIVLAFILAFIAFRLLAVCRWRRRRRPRRLCSSFSGSSFPPVDQLAGQHSQPRSVFMAHSICHSCYARDKHEAEPHMLRTGATGISNCRKWGFRGQRCKVHVVSIEFWHSGSVLSLNWCTQLLLAPLVWLH